jgi:hypothetical protein
LNNRVRHENDRRKREEDRFKFTLWKKIDAGQSGRFQTAKKKTVLERRWHFRVKGHFGKTGVTIT